MTQSTYSVMGSRLHLVLDDEFAANYNAAQNAFFKAQKDHMDRTGSAWTGHEPLMIEWTEKQKAAFNKFAELMNLLIEVNGGSLDISEEEMGSDFLEKLD